MGGRSFFKESKKTGCASWQRLAGKPDNRHTFYHTIVFTKFILCYVLFRN